MRLKQPGDDEADDCHDVDEDVHRGAGGVLEGITDGVADDAGFVGGRSFAAVVAILNVLLGIVPRATGVGHEEGEEDAAEESSNESSGESLGACLCSFRTNKIETESYHDRGAHGEEGRADHALSGGLGRDVDAAVTVWFDGSFENAGLGFELPADFLDHTAGSLADGVHGECAIVEGNCATDQKPNEEVAEGISVGEVELDLGFLNEGGDESEGSESGGPDGEAFSDGSGGVPNDVEGVSDFAGFFTHFGHFGNATCVVGDGAVGIDGHGDTDGAEHSNCGESNAVKAGEFVGSIEGSGDGEDGKDDGFESD